MVCMFPPILVHQASSPDTMLLGLVGLVCTALVTYWVLTNPGSIGRMVDSLRRTL